MREGSVLKGFSMIAVQPHETAQDKERFQLLVDAVTDYAIYMLDPKGVIASWNSGAQRFKGYIESEILGEHFSRFYTEEDRASGLPQRALETATREGKFETEGWRVRKDGTRFWAHVVIDPIRDAKGNLLGFAKITRDLTERRRTEDALRESEQACRTALSKPRSGRASSRPRAGACARTAPASGPASSSIRSTTTARS